MKVNVILKSGSVVTLLNVYSINSNNDFKQMLYRKKDLLGDTMQCSTWHESTIEMIVVK